MSGKEFFKQIMFALDSYISSDHPETYKIEFVADKEFHIDIINESFDKNSPTNVLIYIPREDLDISSV